jgi:hypothetical protein
MDFNTVEEAIKALIGKVVTIINPYSYITTLTGYKIDAEAYRGKIVSIEEGTVKIVTEFIKDPQKEIKAKALQLIPVNHIKRVSISPNEIFLTV